MDDLDEDSKSQFRGENADKCELDEDDPLWLVNEQIKGLLEGDGADEDHQDVITFLKKTGLPDDTVKRIHKAIVCAEIKDEKIKALEADNKKAWGVVAETSEAVTKYINRNAVIINLSESYIKTISNAVCKAQCEILCEEALTELRKIK